MDAIITVVGTDAVGIIARVTAVLMENMVNILNISQITMDEYFTMMMKVDLTKMPCPRQDLKSALDKVGQDIGVQITIMHEDVLKAMHRI